MFGGAEVRASAPPCQEAPAEPEPTTGAAAAGCCQPGDNTDLSPDEVELGVTLHTSGTLEAQGNGEKQDVTQRSPAHSASFQFH